MFRADVRNILTGRASLHVLQLQSVAVVVCCSCSVLQLQRVVGEECKVFDI